MPTNAAGGVLWRPGRRYPKVAVIHRPRYDDWSLPKGKTKAGEPTLLTAVREVQEETGFRPAVQDRLSSLVYETGSGSKVVDYWAMRATGGQFRECDEVDALEWLGPKKASARLSYDDDRELLEEFHTRPRPAHVVLLARHASAGKRSQWRRPDDLRPLDGVGRRDARLAARVMPAFGVEAVYTADLVRCRQTAEPVGAALGLPVESYPDLSDATYAARPAHARRALLDLAGRHEVSYVCSQGGAIPGLLLDLSAAAELEVEPDTRKGALWVLGFDAECTLLFADYLRRPGQ